MMSKEDYIKSMQPSLSMQNRYSEPKYTCPNCEIGGMCKDSYGAICLTSMPPQYRYKYKCNNCGYEEELGV